MLWMWLMLSYPVSWVTSTSPFLSPSLSPQQLTCHRVMLRVSLRCFWSHSHHQHHCQGSCWTRMSVWAMAAVAKQDFCLQPHSIWSLSSTLLTPSPAMFLRNRSCLPPPNNAPCLQDKVQAPYLEIFLTLASSYLPHLSTAKSLPGLWPPGTLTLVLWNQHWLASFLPLLNLFSLVMAFPTPFSAGRMAALFTAQLKCFLFNKAFLAASTPKAQVSSQDFI